jgi:hypothetical protein
MPWRDAMQVTGLQKNEAVFLVIVERAEDSGKEWANMEILPSTCLLMALDIPSSTHQS